MLETVFLEYWYWWWLLAVLVYYTVVLEKSVGVKYLLSTPVRYSPPKGVGVLLCGLIYDRFTEHTDFVAAILELKVMGFVEINREQNGDLLIIRTENSDATLTPQVEYMLEKILFANNAKFYLIPKSFYVKNHRDQWEGSQRYAQIVKDYQTIGIKSSEWAVTEGYMKENPKKARGRFVGWSILLVVLLLVFGIFSGMVPGFFAFISFFFIYFPFFFVVYHKSIFAKLFTGLLMFMVIGVIVTNDEFRQILFEELHLWLYIVVGVVQVAFIFTYEYVGALSPKGKLIRNHLMGYKVFLERVKRDEVKRQKEEDPEYVDNVLPYMVLFGITDHDLNFEKLEDLPR